MKPHTKSGSLHGQLTLPIAVLLCVCVLGIIGFDILHGGSQIERVIALSVATLAVITAVAILVNKRVVKPLDAFFLQEYSKLRHGKASQHYKRPRNEIGDVYALFEDLLSRVDETEQRQKRLAELEKIAEKWPDLFTQPHSG